jgi:hypothetical protein
MAKTEAKPTKSKRVKRSGVTWNAVRKIALALPGVEEGTSYGTPAFRVKGKFMARLKEDNDSLVVLMDMIEREAVLEADPAVFYITDHYRDYPSVLVRLSQVDRAELADLLEQSWRRAAPKRLLQELDAAPGRKKAR